MRGGNLISIVNVPNSIITGLKDEIDLCFVNPLVAVLPYLDVFTSNEVDVKVETGHLEIVESPYTAKLILRSEHVITSFDSDRKRNFDYFSFINMNENLVEFVDRTKRVSAQSGKIYFGTRGGYLYIRVGSDQDELNSEIMLNLVECNFKDIELKFDFKVFMNLFSILDNNFRISFGYVDDQEIGLIYTEKSDGSEMYYMMSRM